MTDDQITQRVRRLEYSMRELKIRVEYHLEAAKWEERKEWRQYHLDAAEWRREKLNNLLEGP